MSSHLSVLGFYQTLENYDRRKSHRVTGRVNGNTAMAGRPNAKEGLQELEFILFVSQPFVMVGLNNSMFKCVRGY